MVVAFHGLVCLRGSDGGSTSERRPASPSFCSSLPSNPSIRRSPRTDGRRRYSLFPKYNRSPLGAREPQTSCVSWRLSLYSLHRFYSWSYSCSCSWCLFAPVVFRLNLGCFSVVFCIAISFRRTSIATIYIVSSAGLDIGAYSCPAQLAKHTQRRNIGFYSIERIISDCLIQHELFLLVGHIYRISKTAIESKCFSDFCSITFTHRAPPPWMKYLLKRCKVSPSRTLSWTHTSDMTMPIFRMYRITDRGSGMLNRSAISNVDHIPPHTSNEKTRNSLFLK